MTRPSLSLNWYEPGVSGIVPVGGRCSTPSNLRPRPSEIDRHPGGPSGTIESAMGSYPHSVDADDRPAAEAAGFTMRAQITDSQQPSDVIDMLALAAFAD